VKIFSKKNWTCDIFLLNCWDNELKMCDYPFYIKKHFLAKVNKIQNSKNQRIRTQRLYTLIRISQKKLFFFLYQKLSNVTDMTPVTCDMHMTSFYFNVHISVKTSIRSCLTRLTDNIMTKHCRYMMFLTFKRSFFIFFQIV
jgi:hypothetical protein